ncbi:Protein kinase, ATP binding site-containing protein [Cynara cardunculus var. scolymus]|uniref:Protein kinase, ATP binding site-containing protein n=1 Tax=Cynara cardunculus var. scolymus TaxID=59895 RepID=A0A118K377_CYNCS|nr:Protein kinase, ATP binding site-containing protein [Cynara cardunculus var. scolymus]
MDDLKISLPDILLATNNFDENNIIGSGGFGKVYQGQSKQYGTIAVKRSDRFSSPGDHEFWMEVSVLSAYKHENLVSLVGYCHQDGKRILVYKHESNGSLDKLLQSKQLSWILRLRIGIDIAHGLKYLHVDIGSEKRVLHGDVKSANILLNHNWSAKISDFGLSKIRSANDPFTFLTSDVCGTIGYHDQEYFETGVFTQKSDIYSFGVVLFEILCGIPASDQEYLGESRSLSILAKKHYENGKLAKLIDPDLHRQMYSTSLSTFSAIAYRCLNEHREDRPTMSQIVVQLEEALNEQLVESSFNGLRHDAHINVRVEDHQRVSTPNDVTHKAIHQSRHKMLKESFPSHPLVRKAVDIVE